MSVAVVVSVIVVAALVVLLAVSVHLARKTLRWLTRTPATCVTRPRRHPGKPSRSSTSTPPAYGHLPTPADPVGALGSLSPDADLSSGSMSESDLLGE